MSCINCIHQMKRRSENNSKLLKNDLCKYQKKFNSTKKIIKSQYKKNQGFTILIT